MNTQACSGDHEYVFQVLYDNEGKSATKRILYCRFCGHVINLDLEMATSVKMEKPKYIKNIPDISVVDRGKDVEG